MILFILMIAAETLIAFLFGTVVMDVCHYLFHRWLLSKHPILNQLGRFHLAHHRFYSSHLQFSHAWTSKNLYYHVLPEYLIQTAGIFTCFLFLHPLAVLIAFFLQTCIFIQVCYQQGRDWHHLPHQRLFSYRGGPWVSAEYHALHHVYPNRYFSSYIKIWDYILGSGQQLSAKRIAMTGAGGALGREMKRLLEKEGAIVKTFKFGQDYTYDDYSQLEPILKETDILFLCHGSKYENAQAANCDSFVNIIELFKKVRRRELVPIEIWGVGSEIECHPCFGIKKLKVYAKSKRDYAKHAKVYFHDKNIQYRHIVHSAFTSPMGPGLMSAKVAAILTLFFIKRGFKYIPITYTGFAWLNYFFYLLSPRQLTKAKTK